MFNIKQDSFYTKDFKHYQLLGWNKYISTTSFLILKELRSIEQSVHYDLNKYAFTNSKPFFIRDNQIMDLLGIGGRNTVRNAIKQLEKYNLIQILGDRSKNKTGTATEYLITKPIPIPKEIKTPETFLKLYGEIWCYKEIEELKKLHEVEEGSETEHFIDTNIPEVQTKTPRVGDETEPQLRLKNKTQTTEVENSNNEKNPQIKNIIEALTTVEEFSKFNISDTVIRLSKDYNLEDIEIVSLYFKQKGFWSDEREAGSLYSILKYCIENIERYTLNSNSAASTPTIEEFTKNSFLSDEKPIEYNHDPESFSF